MNLKYCHHSCPFTLFSIVGWCLQLEAALLLSRLLLHYWLLPKIACAAQTIENWHLKQIDFIHKNDYRRCKSVVTADHNQNHINSAPDWAGFGVYHQSRSMSMQFVRKRVGFLTITIGAYKTIKLLGWIYSDLFTSNCDQCYCNWLPAVALHLGFTSYQDCCYQRNSAAARGGVQSIAITM